MTWAFTQDPNYLTSDATAGSKTITVTDGTLFRVKDRIKIADDTGNWEHNIIISISDNTLTLISTLTNTYTVAANAYAQVYAILPINPRKVTVKFTAVTKVIPFPGEQAIVMRFGKQPKVLTLTGLFFKPGRDLTHIETWYIFPFQNLVYEEITLLAPDSRYDGTYVLTSFVFEERGGRPSLVSYKIELMQGSEHIGL